MAVSSIGWATVTSFSTPSSLATTAGGGTTGDLEVLVLFRASTSTASPGGLSGWTNVFETSATGGTRLGMWYRDWSSSSVTLTDLDSAYVIASRGTLRGHTTTGITASSEATGTNTTVAGGSLTAATGDMLLSMLSVYDSYTTPSPSITHPSGMTSRVSSANQAANWGGGAYAYVNLYVDSESPSAGSTGTRSWVADDPLYDSAAMRVRNVIIPAATSTTHTAEATRATTATTSADATRERFAEAAPSHTATVTASASVDRVASATSSASATVTAEATVERAASASLAVTATSTASAAGGVDAASSLSATASLTAAADVTSPGVVTMDVALAVTAATSTAAAINAAVVGTLAATASFAAEATTTTVHEAQASRAVTAAINAAAAVLVGGVGDPGHMSLADIARATMKPANSTGATMRTVLVGFNTATMQAVLDDAATAPLLGVPVFVGDDDPVALELIALTTPHVWFHDGTVTVREG